MTACNLMTTLTTLASYRRLYELSCNTSHPTHTHIHTSHLTHTHTSHPTHIHTHTSHPTHTCTHRFLNGASICSSRLPLLMLLFDLNNHHSLTRKKSYWNSTSNNSITTPSKTFWPTTSREMAPEGKVCSCR